MDVVTKIVLMLMLMFALSTKALTSSTSTIGPVTTQADSNEEPNTQNEPESTEVGEAEGEAEVEPEGETEVDPEGETGVEPEGETEVDPEGDTEVDPEGDTEVDPEGDTEVDPEGDTEVDPEGDTEVDPEGETEVETEGETGVEPEGETEVETEGETEVDPEGETEVDPEGDTEVNPEGEAEVEPNPEGVAPGDLPPGAIIYYEGFDEERQNQENGSPESNDGGTTRYPHGGIGSEKLPDYYDDGDVEPEGETVYPENTDRLSKPKYTDRFREYLKNKEADEQASKLQTILMYTMVCVGACVVVLLVILILLVLTGTKRSGKYEFKTPDGNKTWTSKQHFPTSDDIL